MTTLVLVRHATTPVTGKRLGGWTPGVHLDDHGRDQAEATAGRLVGVPLGAVYASPLERTQETARIIARPHGLRVRTRHGLGEVDYGEWTDRHLGHLRRRREWATIMHSPSRMTFPGGESIRAAQARVVEALEDIAAEHPEDTVVVVSHADVIKAAIAHYLAMPLDAFQRLDIAPASLSVLRIAAAVPAVLSRLNDTGPLGPGRPDRSSDGRRRAGRREEAR